MTSAVHFSRHFNSLLSLCVSAVFAASAPAAPVPAKTEKKTPPTKNEPVNQGGGANTTPPIVANNGVIALRTEKATLGLPLFLLRAGSGFTVLDVKLTATATANPQLASGEINCRAFPGPDGVRAAAFVKQQLFKRHNAWLRGTQIDIACAEKIPGGDLPAAAVTEALLVDAMILGYDLEPNFVALGDFDSDGGLIPTLATGTRVLAALRGGAVRITVPEKSTPQVADVMLAEGPAKFASVQIFAVSGFDEIPPLAAAQLDTKVQRAMSIFGRAQVLLNDAGDRADAALTDPRVKEALREVLIEAPNHLTARLLLGHGAGQFKTYSLAGSIETIEQRAP